MSGARARRADRRRRRGFGARPCRGFWVRRGASPREDLRRRPLPPPLEPPRLAARVLGGGSCSKLDARATMMTIGVVAPPPPPPTHLALERNLRDRVRQQGALVRVRLVARGAEAPAVGAGLGRRLADRARGLVPPERAAPVWHSVACVEGCLSRPPPIAGARSARAGVCVFVFFSGVVLWTGARGDGVVRERWWVCAGRRYRTGERRLLRLVPPLLLLQNTLITPRAPHRSLPHTHTHSTPRPPYYLLDRPSRTSPSPRTRGKTHATHARANSGGALEATPSRPPLSLPAPSLSPPRSITQRAVRARAPSRGAEHTTQPT